MFRLVGSEIEVRMTRREAGLLAGIPALLDSIHPGSGDPGYDVLHRSVYPDDPEADSELVDVVLDDVEAQRTADRRVVERVALEGSSMSRDDAGSFLRAINEVRLVLAARAGAFDEETSWEDRIGNDPALAAVAWLGYVQSELIETLSRF